MLVAEDNPDDVWLLERALAKSGLPVKPRFFTNGDEVLDYLHGRPPFTDRSLFPLPRFVLLDLKMPGKNGFDVLHDVRSDSQLKRLVAVVFTSSTLDTDIDRAYDLGANAFVVKPGDYGDMIPILRRIYDFWFLTNQPSRTVGLEI